MVNEILSQKGTGLKIICLHLYTFVNITAPNLLQLNFGLEIMDEGSFLYCDKRRPVTCYLLVFPWVKHHI